MQRQDKLLLPDLARPISTKRCKSFLRYSERWSLSPRIKTNMTSIAIYRFSHPDGGPEELWAVGDTRITSSTYGSKDVKESITSGAKIFSIPVCVSKTLAQHEGGETMLETTIGMAYAGNSTLGLNLHAQLSQILPHLVCDDFAEAPFISLEQIADFAGMILHRMVQEMNWRYVSAEQVQTAEVALFGRCPATGELHVYLVRPSFENGELTCKPNDVTPKNAVSAFLKHEIGAVLLGAHKQEITELIFARVADVLEPGALFMDPEVQANAAMAPKYVLEALIHHDIFPTIGRGLQVMISRENGVFPFTWGRPQSESVPAEDYEMYSLFNINVLRALKHLGKTNIHYWPSVGPDYDVDIKGFALISEFHQALLRLKGEPPPILMLSYR